ncbi:MAG: WG repeat-containing protein [Bacteroidales bacterium]|nr:WG repeat-containing protein [Bacteroidales bacterium]
MKNVIKAALVLAVVAMAASCSNQDKEDYPYSTRYLPVVLQGSTRWSILDIETGEVVAKDAFKQAPSAIVDDMFYVPGDKGGIYYYSMSDPKHPVNKEPYASGTEFSTDGLAVASRKGGNLQVIDKTCKTVADLGDSIVQCSMFDRGLAVAGNAQGKQGFVDKQGKVAIPMQYDQVAPFQYCDHTVAMNQQDTAYVDFSFIDRTGKETFSSNSTMYKPGPVFKRDVLKVQKRDTLVCLNPEGKEVPDPAQVPDKILKSYDAAKAVGKSYIVIKDGLAGLVDHSGQQLLPLKYADLRDIASNRLLAAKKGDNYYRLVDDQGKPVGKAKIVHVNGTPSTNAVIGKVDPANVAARLMMPIDERGYAGIAKGADVATFYQMLDGVHPEQYNGNNVLVTQMGNVVFDGPIVSKVAGGYSFNLKTPVQAVMATADVSIYPNDTEQQVVDIMAQNMGKAGFVETGGNVFASATGTAVAIGYAKGTIMVVYYMDKAKARPIANEPR